MIVNSKTERMCDQYQVPRKGTKPEKAFSNTPQYVTLSYPDNLYLRSSLSQRP